MGSFQPEKLVLQGKCPLFPKAVIQAPRKLLKSRAAFGQKRKFDESNWLPKTGAGAWGIRLWEDDHGLRLCLNRRKL